MIAVGAMAGRGGFITRRGDERRFCSGDSGRRSQSQSLPELFLEIARLEGDLRYEVAIPPVAMG